MAKRVTIDKLRKAGFTLESCPDGRFWVIDQGPGEEAERIAAVCRLYLEDLDSTAVRDELVLQCDCVFKDPALYVDGFMWNLAPGDFARIVARLGRHHRAELPNILFWADKYKTDKESEKENHGKEELKNNGKG